MAGGPRRIVPIAVALLTSAGLGFVLLAIISRWLTVEENATFLTVWGTLFALGSVVSATEQEIARQATRARLSGSRAPGSVIQQSILALVLTGAILVVVSVVPATRSLVSSSPSVAALVGLAIIGFTGQFLVRGVLLGSGRTGSYSIVISAEAVVRVVVVGTFLLTVKGTVPLAVAATAAGCFGWILVARAAWRKLDFRSAFEPWRVAGHRLGMLAVSNFLSSLILTGFPALVTLVVGSPTGLAVFFGSVTLARVPLIALSPVQTLTVPTVVSILHAGDASRLVRLQGRVVALTLVAALAAGSLGYWLGPFAVRLFLGPDYSAPGWMIGLLLSASCLLAAALLQLAAFVAMERYKFVVLAWTVAVAAAIASLFWFPGSPEARGTAAFVAASVAALAVSGVLLQTAVRSHEGAARAEV